MAKASMKAREERRRKTVLKYAAKRAELRERSSADKTTKTSSGR
jgi:hypothetical protein